MPKDIEIALAQRMKMVRLLRELSIEDVALKVGVTPRTYKKYEKGANKHIKSDRIEKIAESLDCSPGYLLGWTVDLKQKA